MEKVLFKVVKKDILKQLEFVYTTCRKEYFWSQKGTNLDETFSWIHSKTKEIAGLKGGYVLIYQAKQLRVILLDFESANKVVTPDFIRFSQTIQ